MTRKTVLVPVGCLVVLSLGVALAPRSGRKSPARPSRAPTTATSVVAETPVTLPPAEQAVAVESPLSPRTVRERAVPLSQGAKRMCDNVLSAPPEADLSPMAAHARTVPELREALVAELSARLPRADRESRCRILGLLAGLGDASAAALWKASLTSDPDPVVRRTLAGRVPADLLADAEVRSALVALAIGDVDASVRGAALGSLPVDLVKERASALADHLAVEPDAQTRDTLVRVLWQGGMSDARAVAGLRRIAEDPTQPRQTRAAAYAGLVDARAAHPDAVAGVDLPSLEREIGAPR